MPSMLTPQARRVAKRDELTDGKWYVVITETTPCKIYFGLKEKSKGMVDMIKDRVHRWQLK